MKAYHSINYCSIVFKFLADWNMDLKAKIEVSKKFLCVKWNDDMNKLTMLLLSLFTTTGSEQGSKIQLWLWCDCKKLLKKKGGKDECKRI